VRKFRKNIFVCSSITDDFKLISKIIEANTKEEANSLFLEQFSIQPKEIFGHFYKGKKSVESHSKIKFSNQTKKAIYNDYYVDAFLLSEPENHAYLIFLSRIDNKKTSLPKGTFIVPLCDLRF
jgi:hypothetical protein